MRKTKETSETKTETANIKTAKETKIAIVKKAKTATTKPAKSKSSSTSTTSSTSVSTEREFKSGIEIHQRLDTHKLFCRCPSIEGAGEATKKVTRRLHFVRSEVGEVDRTAAFESAKDVQITYDYFSNSGCEVELDESPPLGLNMDALRIALQISLMLNARPVDELHIMRKQVVDGSNTSGFQRTSVIALDGYIETSKGRVGIDTISLEEESAGIEAKDKQAFSLDRLGVPLVEIATSPDIQTPEHGKEVAEKIGTILRLAKVKRGIGTIRQDVNISIPGGARVEIKGVQELADIPEIIKNEIKRQQNLIEIHKRISPLLKLNDKISVVDLTELFDATQCKIVNNEMKKEGKDCVVLGLRLAGFKGILGAELIPDVRYGTELAKYAGAAGVKGIIHSDENLDNYGFTVEEVSSVKLALGAKEGDAFVIVVGKEGIANKAVDFMLNRLFMVEIPEETRMARGASTFFMRPLAGRARMYPETDIPPVRITSEMIAHARESAGETLEDKITRFEKLVGKEYAARLVRSEQRGVFESLVEKGRDPKIIAVILIEKTVALRRENLDVSKITEEKIDGVLSLYSEGKIVKSAIDDVLRGVCESPGKSITDIVKEKKLARITGEELKQIIAQEDYDIKKIMSKYRLNVDPEEASKIIKAKK